MTDEQFTNGMEQVEKDIAKNAQAGKPSYPPSYAEFVGLANRKDEAIPPSHRSWAGLPRPTMTNEARKEQMRKVLEMMM